MLALLSGISGSGPSRSKPEASWPSAIDNEAMPLSGCTRLEQDSLFTGLLWRSRRRRRGGWAGFGERQTGVAGYNHSFEALPTRLLLLQQISSKIALVGCSLRRAAQDR
jgi:hypothetical protein